MAKHKVNWNLHMGKTQHRPGDVIDLDAESAAPLVGCGVLTPLPKEESSTVEDMSPSQLAKLPKEQLAEYALKRHGVELNPADQTKDAMLAAIAERAASKESE